MTDSKPGRIKSILDYLQTDVPKTGGSEESVPGEHMGQVPSLNSAPALNPSGAPQLGLGGNNDNKPPKLKRRFV